MQERPSNKVDENKLADPVGVTLTSDRSAVQLDRNRSRSEGNIGEEIEDVRPILSSLEWQINGCHRGSVWFK